MEEVVSLWRPLKREKSKEEKIVLKKLHFCVDKARDVEPRAEHGGSLVLLRFWFGSGTQWDHVIKPDGSSEVTVVCPHGRSI